MMRKCEKHSGRGRAPHDCPDCNNLRVMLDGVEVDYTEYRMPVIDDNPVFVVGDKLIKPLFNLYKTWEAQIKYAKVGIIENILDGVAEVYYPDFRERFTVDLSLCVKVIS